MNSKVLVISALCIFISSLQLVSGLKCYNCVDAEDSKCGKKFDADSFTPVEATLPEIRNLPTRKPTTVSPASRENKAIEFVCYVTKTKIGTKIMYQRGAGLKNMCALIGDYIECTECSSDKCNSATSRTISACLLALVSVFAIYMR